MKTQNGKFTLILMTVMIAGFLWSCNYDREDFQGEKYGSVNKGKLSIHCEESVYHLFDSVFKMYRQSYPKIELNVEIVNSRTAMALLLSGKTEAVITARTFLSDEDSLMKAYKVTRPEMIIASDALVFYVNKDFPLDTLNDLQLVNILSGEKKLTDYFPSVSAEPEYVCNSTNSSEFANIQMIVMKDKKLKKYFKTFNSCDSVLNYVANNSNSIGIGYLSQIYKNPNLKALEIGFVNKNGKSIYPQVVHQGYIVQEKYPYIPKIRVFILNDRKTKPFWFASFVSKETVVQKYLKDMGIVPEFAKFKLRIEK